MNMQLAVIVIVMLLVMLVPHLYDMTSESED